MATILGLYNRLQQVDTDKIAQETIEGTEEEINEYNLQQLIDGKTNEGTDISPSYFEDPYFDTWEQAKAYSDWKDKISPISRRRPGIPNLFINGYYHASRKVQIVGDKIIYGSTWNEGIEIENKYENLDGLNPESRRIYIPEVLRPAFNHLIEQATGLKMK
jgi:hypothetical protein